MSKQISLRLALTMMALTFLVGTLISGVSTAIAGGGSMPRVDIYYVDTQVWAAVHRRGLDSVYISLQSACDLVQSSEDAASVLGGEITDWSPIKEDQGVAWSFRPPKARRLNVRFGVIDLAKGRITTDLDEDVAGATWRCISRKTPVQTVAPPPSGSTCMTGVELARRNGWQLADNQPASVTKYGGAVVRGAVKVPEGWSAITAADGSFTSIYPPSGPCRNQLGVSQ